jgi:hypothetical protein
VKKNRPKRNPTQSACQNLCIQPLNKIATKNVDYFCNLQATAKGNNQSLGENSANLVTLLGSRKYSQRRKIFSTHFNLLRMYAYVLLRTYM